MLKTTESLPLPQKVRSRGRLNLYAKDKYYALLFLGPSFLVLSIFVFYPLSYGLYILVCF